MPLTLTPFADYANNVMELRYAHVVHGYKETWYDICKRVCRNVMAVGNVSNDVYDAVYEAMISRKFIPGGRILSQAGREYHQTDNCYTLRAKDTREGWANLAQKCTMMFMSGGGVGVSYDDIREYGVPLKRSGGISSGPIPLIQMVNSIGAAARQGGERRGAIYASLRWDHPDIQQFIEMKKDGESLKHTNISVRFDNDFLKDICTATNYDENWDCKFYDTDKYATFMKTLKYACKYGDPGFQFDNDDQILRNACTEIISSDDGDSCCLGSVNLAAIDSLQELGEITELGTLFLLCNTLYTDLPTQQVKDVKEKNRRLGLGIMGIGEWFIQRSLPYGYTQLERDSSIDYTDTFSIGKWLQVYKDQSTIAASACAAKLNIATPIAVRAIAPTGTISIAAGLTTPGIEPVFHTAYQRTYNTLKSQQHSNGYVTEVIIDPIVQKWIEQGYDVRDIDTAYTLSQSIDGIERRLKFQAFVQQYVDNAISSTVNLPRYEEGIEDKIAPILLKYLPQLRGVTFYPDGRYENQPVVPVDISDILGADNIKQEVYESCKGDGCGA